MPRAAIKARALADFIAEFTGSGQSTEENTDDLQWDMYIDGASNKSGSGAGVVIRTPEGTEITKVVSFGFQASNNKAEYKALVIDLQLAKVCGLTNLHMFCDSQLVVGQVLGEFETNGEKMKAYVVLRLMSDFQVCTSTKSRAR